MQATPTNHINELTEFMDKFFSKGFLSNDLFSNGLLSKGFFSNGLLSKGFFSNGLFSNGWFSNGLFSNGLFSIGLFSNGLPFSAICLVLMKALDAYRTRRLAYYEVVHLLRPSIE